MAIAGAAAAFDDVEYFQKTTRAVIGSRERLCAEMKSLGFAILPSAANFIFVTHAKHDAAELAAALRERSVIVRHFKSARISQYLRITIGTDAQNAVLIDALKAIVA
jgi:histidinol-phosphate aminotransferase